MFSKTEMDPCHHLPQSSGQTQEDEKEVMCLWWLMAIDKGSVTNMGNCAACIYFIFLFFPHRCTLRPSERTQGVGRGSENGCRSWK